MNELNIEEMTSLRGGVSGFNSGNISAFVAGNTATAATTNLETASNNTTGAFNAAAQRTITQTTTATAGTITLTQNAGTVTPIS
jgi:hypothetical protein